MALKPVLEPLDQTSEFAIVNNTVCDATITLQIGHQVFPPVIVNSLDLNWTGAATNQFTQSNLSDNSHRIFQGDFTGASKTQALIYDSVNDAWWLGTISGTSLGWQYLASIGPRGNLLDGHYQMWSGNFLSHGSSQILLYWSVTGDWFIGSVVNNSLSWTHVGNTSSNPNFGNLLDGNHLFLTGNFSGAQKLQILFYYSGDGNWWLGSVGNTLTWHRVGNTSNAPNNFGNLLDGHHPMWIGDYLGIGSEGILFQYCSDIGDGNWWFGTISSGALNWSKVGNNEFGNLRDGDHAIWVADFTGVGRDQLLLYYSGNGQWLLGNITNSKLNWALIGNTSGFGNLLDANHKIWQGQYCGNGIASILMYSSSDSNWWHARVSNTSIEWTLPGNTRGYGNLLDVHHILLSGQFSGSVKSEILLHYSGRGDFILGKFDGAHIRLPRNLQPGEVLYARQETNFTLIYSDPVTVRHNYPTQHYDRQRTGWNFRETTLNVGNVPMMKQKFRMKVDGQVYAQPLYMDGLSIPGKGVRNVIFVVTENNSVYAFDADNGAILWQRSLLQSGESAVQPQWIGGSPNIAPLVGITSTPAIDCCRGILYVVTKLIHWDSSTGTLHQYLHALDITTGAEPPQNRSEVTGEIGNVTFDPQWQLNRPALLMVNDTIYVAFGSHGDRGTYNGWIMSYDATTLNQQHIFCVTPTGSQGSIWMSGMGLASDGGYIYCTTGNGDFTANKGGNNYGNCVLKLSLDLRLQSWFAPADQALLNDYDIDLGSGGVLLLPQQVGPHPNLLVTCGKDGNIILLNRDNLGGYSGPPPAWDPNKPATRSQYPGNNPNALFTILLQPSVLPSSPQAGSPPNALNSPGIWGGPAYFAGTAEHLIFMTGSHGPLTAFSLINGSLRPVSSTTGPFPAEGGTIPVVSSNGQPASDGIVWAIARRDSTNKLHLRAFNATNLANGLFPLGSDSPANECGPWNNSEGGAFVEPTVINGKVYIGSDGWITVFGL